MSMEEMVSKLSSALEIVMNPVTSREHRLEAHQFCEDFKENSVHCAQCGVLMASCQQPYIVRHFGLQLLEHCVRFRWNTISGEEKLFIKDSTAKLISSGTLDLLSEAAHIKDALSRIVVEMVKREWPQQWPTLMQELDTLCKLGPTQTELVLLVFLRLAEDIVLFQNVQQQRKREILHAMNSGMPTLCAFFMNTLQTSYSAYQQLKCSARNADDQRTYEVHCRLVRAALDTLSAYVDWINIQLVFQNHENPCSTELLVSDENPTLLRLICSMLHDAELRLAAVDCLLVITNRRGKIEERKPILVLFSENPMSAILTAAVVAANSQPDEENYLFLKRLCQVLTSIGSQLCALWGSTEDVVQLPNFLKYLEAILAFMQHPSQMLCSYTLSLWGTFFRHPVISQDPVLIAFIPNMMKIIPTITLKTGFPSQNSSPSCEYARLDFESDAEFLRFYAKYRTDIASLIRSATLIAPTVTFAFVKEWLHDQLKKPLDIGQDADREYCNLSSPSFLEWDSLTVFFESVMSRLDINDSGQTFIADGTELLQATLAYETNDPLIKSCVLSCLSALFIFIKHVAHVLPAVIDKILAIVVFTFDGQTKATRIKSVKNVRRHACSVMVKISKQYPDLLLPAFDSLCEHIDRLSSHENSLSQMEKGNLIESLILISNQYQNFEKQQSFIGEILEAVKKIWHSAVLKESMWSTEKFITYVGLDQPPVEPSSADTCGINRSQIVYCATMMRVVLTRSTWPSDPEVAKTGGFVTRVHDNGTAVLCNPAASSIIPMLDTVLALARTLNGLWLSENLVRRHAEFSKAYDVLDVDKRVILGVNPPCVDNTDSQIHKHPVERMQRFLTVISEHCCHVLAYAAQTLGYDFFQSPNLASSLINSVFYGLDTVPDYRLKPIIRAFMKAYVVNCPTEHLSTALLPVLAVLFPHMFQRLNTKWSSLCQRYENATEADEEENPESQEMLEEQLTRQLTREYIDLLIVIFLDARSSSTVEPGEDTAMEDVDFPAPAPAPPPASHPPTQGPLDEKLSDVGQLILKNTEIYASAVMTIFNGLMWIDNGTCTKCLKLCWPIVKQMLVNESLLADDASHLFTAILHGLQQHGQHDGTLSTLISLGCQMYEALWRLHPVVGQIMLQVPGCSAASLKMFEDKMLTSTPQKQLPERKKKEAFKRLVQDIIGKNIGQEFKKHAHIKNLPPMLRANRAKSTPLLEQENGDIGLCALFKPEAT